MIGPTWRRCRHERTARHQSRVDPAAAAQSLRERGEDVPFGLQRYAVERFLYRLGRSAHRERFVLKGATLFALWGGSATGRRVISTSLATAARRRQMYSLHCARSAYLRTTATSSSSTLIRSRQSRSATTASTTDCASGLRRRLASHASRSRSTSDSATRSIRRRKKPSIRPCSGIPRRAFSPIRPEAVVAEKLHAMVMLGERNSRYKDFYDLHVLAQTFRFDGERSRARDRRNLRAPPHTDRGRTSGRAYAALLLRRVPARHSGAPT